MKPRPLIILSAFSVLLCIAVSVLWLRSHHTHHLLLFPALGRVWQVSSLGGAFCVIIHRDTDIAPLSCFDAYPFSDGIQRERRFASDRLIGTRTARYAAEDQYDALRARRRAGDPPIILPRLHVAQENLVQAIQDESRAFARSHATDAILKARDHFGFHYRPAGRDATPLITFPHWTLLTLAPTFPCLHLLLHRRTRRRSKRGHCPHCNYDLRATPDRCPECGHPAQPTLERC